MESDGSVLLLNSSTWASPEKTGSGVRFCTGGAWLRVLLLIPADTEQSLSLCHVWQLRLRCVFARFILTH